ncbi:hypothetical protein G7075_03685 [Phycicoccus sp. HDW14]|uniref:hypothetical protein n=1 Tax=Phycicoccus sp. HDW14 TaxID=2714941 RepID=UPI00140E51E8|nr:hypothetical protein [Phycicoccus sp. HDW14]QIM20454.1 hypothetical protein G7075_03685 [Phycicoccus sp. HDW14]
MPYPVTDVSCWSATSCGLTTEGMGRVSDPELLRWQNGAVTSSVAVPNRSGASELSCPTSTCHFLTQSGGAFYVHRASGSSVTTTRLATDFQGELSCATSTFCMFLGSDGFRTGSGTSWSARKPAEDVIGRNLFSLMDLSCSSSTSCTSVGALGGHDADAMRWDGRQWRTYDLGAGMNTQRALDCAAWTSCMVVDSRGRFTRWTGSSWTSRTTLANSTGGFLALDCTTSTSCLASDMFGNVLTWTGGSTWGRSSLTEGASLVDCAGSTCMATDTAEGDWRVRRSGTWGPRVLDRVYGAFGRVVCSSSTSCFLLYSDQVRRWTGSSWASLVSSVATSAGTSRSTAPARRSAWRSVTAAGP